MTRMERRKRRQRQIRRRVALAFTALAIVAAVLLGGKAEAESPSASVDQTVAEDTTQALYSESVKLVYEMPMQREDMESSSQAAVEDPKESEKIEQALLEQGYLHQEIPLSFDLQCHLKTVCEEYGVPYHIALGVIQAESSFTADATNGICFGYMQINKINAEWLSKEIGVTDLSEPYQNLRSGVYILGDFYGKYGEWHRALICYNYGEGGAQKHVFSKGYTTTGYSRAVMEYANAWLEVIEG